MTTPTTTTQIQAGRTADRVSGGIATWHIAHHGAAVCDPAAALTRLTPAAQVPSRYRCRRAACRRYWHDLPTTPLATGSGAYMCPVCWVERPPRPRRCPSCAATTAPVLEGLMLMPGAGRAA